MRGRVRGRLGVLDMFVGGAALAAVFLAGSGLSMIRRWPWTVGSLRRDRVVSSAAVNREQRSALYNR
jgi:hypothetical protein